MFNITLNYIHAYHVMSPKHSACSNVPIPNIPHTISSSFMYLHYQLSSVISFSSLIQHAITNSTIAPSIFITPMDSTIYEPAKHFIFCTSCLVVYHRLSSHPSYRQAHRQVGGPLAMRRGVSCSALYLYPPRFAATVTMLIVT